MSMAGNNIILSYHESLLRLSDLQLLEGPCWLNDTLISFYFEYLEIEKFSKNAKLLFVPPQVTQCIKVTPSTEMGIFLEPLKTDSQHFIFFALNDNEETDTSGGSHWSLLVFSLPEQSIFHFDSSRGSNQVQAIEFGEKLMQYFGFPSIGCFNEPSAMQQSNGYDCGIHVLCNTEEVASFALKYGKIGGCPQLNKEHVIYKRREIFDLIHTLRHTHK